MIINLVGYKKFKFTNKDNGEVIQGVKVFGVVTDDQDDSLTGSTVWQGSLVGEKAYSRTYNIDDQYFVAITPTKDNKARVTGLLPVGDLDL